MQSLLTKFSKKGILAFAASLLTVGMVVAGCTSSITSTSSTSNIIPNTNTSTSPVTITDAPDDQILATSLTLNTIILTDSAGKVTTNLLAAGPITIEATHLDAIQEPLFSPAIPEDTNQYVSVTLTYSNAQVAYVNTAATPRSIVLDSTPTLANTSQTITFASPITISNTTTSLLVDYLVAQSVAISSCTSSGCTVTVTPTFDVTAVPIPTTPTNGTNGLQTHKGVVAAIGAGTSASTDYFTMINPSGISLTIYVNANTLFQDATSTTTCTGVACLSTFTALKVNALVEVDTITQNSTNPNSLPPGSLLATRVEVDDHGTTAPKLLLGPVTSVTPGNGTAATSFDMVLRQLVGNSSATAVETVDVTVTGSTNFLMPPRFAIFRTGLPFTPSFTASTIFAGQHVAVVTTSTGVTSGAATATTVLLQPQTVRGTINSCVTSNIVGAYTVCNITIPADSWLAKLTGQTNVLVYTNNLVIPINASVTPAVGNTMRFHGYLFNAGGTVPLRLVTVVQADPPGTPIIAGTPPGPTI
jgi:hypothetical protein